MSKPILYYVYDPMCSWCWGYRDTWLKLSEVLSDKVSIHYQLGGLAPDSDVEMPLDLQQSLQSIWHNIHVQLGTQFNFDFWSKCTPQRSTYPACRLCLIARKNNKEKEILFAIQQAYYLQAKNPSITNVLINLAEEVGLNRKDVEQQLHDEKLNTELMQEISNSRQFPIQGFPSLVLAINGQNIPVDIDYRDWKKTYSQIMNLM
ncbi:DsbA family protein [Psychromonas sp. RZ22]|uniref:DsbA family protein n=1 Tax=Psychromonas algarum TaxID=2555643 RepID=UPI0010672AB8|nr:DsbA family protein [Psychromonas sp. RZ22]TEW54821.1 DsbA family protein [Psychromonas sp. RZ22]